MCVLMLPVADAYIGHNASQLEVLQSQISHRHVVQQHSCWLVLCIHHVLLCLIHITHCFAANHYSPLLQTDKVSAEHKSLEEIRSQLQLVLLDFGLAEELTPRVRKHFISFLHMISAGNGRRAAHHMLLFSSKQECRRPEAFADDMEALFNVEAQINGPEGIDVDKVQDSICMFVQVSSG